MLDAASQLLYSNYGIVILTYRGPAPTTSRSEAIATYTHGRQNIKAGFQYVRIRQDWQYAGNNGALGSMYLNSLSDFWLGGPVAPWCHRDAFVTRSIFKDRGNVIAAYLQDNWRVTNTLTLNLGLRFEDHTPIYEENGNVVNFDIMTGAILTPKTPGAFRALYNNYVGLGAFQPRIGFAWSPAMMHGKTVVSGGYGISSFHEGMGSYESLSINQPFGACSNLARSTARSAARHLFSAACLAATSAHGLDCDGRCCR